MQRSTGQQSSVPVARIAAVVRGRVIGPADADYDAARTVMFGGIDKRPALIVRAADARDVQRVIALARDSGIELAVRGGGHSAAGHSTTEGGIVLDLHDMKRLEIDVEARTAWAEAGLTASELSTAAGARGLAIGFGDTGSVGIGGITLGGGVGYLVRKYGLTIDSLLGADVVTADGELHRVDADHHPDLFWAIRGGGGNFGVVTRFHYRLQPLDQIVGGMRMLPGTPDVVAEFIALSESGPDELSTIANVMNCPPMPFVPAEHHGKIVVFGIVCHAGPAAAGERALAPFRALATPIVDMVKPMPYQEIYPPDDPNYHPKAENITMFVDRIDRAAAETIDRSLRASDSSMRVAQLRVLGGAMARVPADATAFAHRSSRIMVNVASFYEGPDDRPRRQGVGRRARVSAAPVGPRGLCQLPGRRGRGAHPGRLSGSDLGPARHDQGALRPDQPVPPQPEHPARWQGDRSSVFLSAATAAVVLVARARLRADGRRSVRPTRSLTLVDRPKRILILGGGFGGLHLVRHLERRLRRGEADVTLVDRSNYSLFTPLLYQVATGELPPHAVAYPLRVPLAHAGVRFLRTEIETIDVEQRVVRTADGELAYDTVVILLGSVTNDYGIPGVREHAVTLKWLEDGRTVRHRILSTFEDAALEPDPARRRERLAFAIVGAGPVGVELAASMRDLMDHTLRGIYPTIDFRREPSITLIDGADRVIPQMDVRLSRIAARRLERLGVHVELGTLVSEITGTSVRTRDGRTIPARTAVWAGGIRTNPVVAAVDLPHAKDGRLIVDALFRAGGRDDVLAFGDAAAVEHHGVPLPQLAQVAVLEAPAAAANIARLVRGEPLVPYRHKRKGDLIALGRTSAAAEFARPVHVVLSGLPAWTVWRTNYLMQLVGVRSRGTLLAEWLLSFFSHRIVADIT